jgi:hypothetical protein
MKKFAVVLVLALVAGNCRPRIELAPDNKLQIQDLRSPVVYTSDTDYFLLDVANYQHDNTTVIMLESINEIPVISYRVDRIWAETATRLRVWINQRWPVKPGQYTITLTQSDNRTAKAPEVIDVRPGRLRWVGLAGHL